MIIGREEEIKTLQDSYSSQRSEFVVVYGRRRIGKTFLVNELFGGKFTLKYTGIYNISSKEQINEFTRSMVEQGLSVPDVKPKNWFDVFSLLKQLINLSSQEKKIVFLDELPWIDSTNSRFLAAFEQFWNGWASARNDLLLIICGSATSWIINKIFRNKGGLYNRVTHKIHLKQFSLYECEKLVEEFDLPFNRNMILEGYMLMGGVPYYWTKLNKKKSLYQNINDLFFRENGELHNEFKIIFASMFKSPEKYIQVIEALSGKKSGLTRDEISKKGKLDNNGQLSQILEDLGECGFIRKYCHTGKKLRDALYQLIDCYSLFYFTFLKNAVQTDEDYWMRIMHQPIYNTWCGLSFERVCLLHSRQIKQALGISGIMANLFSWHIKKTETHPGVQIDLLIDRADNVINICEMKYAPQGYVLTAKSLADLQEKISIFRLYASERKYIEPVLITSNGITPNKYSAEITQQVTAHQLFQP